MEQLKEVNKLKRKRSTAGEGGAIYVICPKVPNIYPFPYCKIGYLGHLSPKKITQDILSYAKTFSAYDIYTFACYQATEDQMKDIDARMRAELMKYK